MLRLIHTIPPELKLNLYPDPLASQELLLMICYRRIKKVEFLYKIHIYYVLEFIL